jgi:hypothetical protein
MPEPSAPQTVDLDESDPKTAPTLLVAAVGVALLLVIILLLEVMYQRTVEAENYRKVIAEQPQELRSLRATQLEQLNGYRWVDQPAGVAAIPIDRAMELVIKDYRAAGAVEPGE